MTSASILSSPGSSARSPAPAPSSAWPGPSSGRHVPCVTGSKFDRFRRSTGIVSSKWSYDNSPWTTSKRAAQLHQELATQAGHKEHQTSARNLVRRSNVFMLALFLIGGLLVAVGATSGMSRYIYIKVDFPGFIVSAVSLLAVSLLAGALAARKGGDFAWLDRI